MPSQTALCQLVSQQLGFPRGRRRTKAVQIEDTRRAETQCAVHSTKPNCQVASTTRPKAMRYQAKGTKSWLEMKRSSQRTHKKAEMKAEMKPTTHMPRSSALSSARSL